MKSAVFSVTSSQMSVTLLAVEKVIVTLHKEQRTIFLESIVKKINIGRYANTTKDSLFYRYQSFKVTENSVMCLP